MNNDQDLLKNSVDTFAQKFNASEFICSRYENTERLILLSNGIDTKTTYFNDKGIGVTGIMDSYHNNNIIHGFTTDISQKGISNLNMNKLHPHSTLTNDINIKEKDIREIFHIDYDDIKNILLDASKVIYNSDKYILQGYFRFEINMTNKYLLNSENFVYNDASNVRVCLGGWSRTKNNEIVCDGLVHLDKEGDYNYLFKKTDQIISSIVNRSLLKQSATKAISKKYPIVLAPRASTLLIHEIVGHSLEADFLLNTKKHFYGDKGFKIAPDEISVYDDPTIPFRYGSYEYDDDGRKSEKTTLIENGVLKNYLLNLHTSRIIGEKFSGNGRAESYHYPSYPRMSNTYLDIGEWKREDIISNIDEGIYIEYFPDAYADLNEGSFYLGSGEVFSIEKGEISASIKPIYIAGLNQKILGKISAIGNDLTFCSGGSLCKKTTFHGLQKIPVDYGAPTILLDNIKINLDND